MMLSCGIFGEIIFIFIFIKFLSWLYKLKSFSQVFSENLILRAVTIVVIFIVNFMTESHFSGKIMPETVLFMFYFLLLDREKYFLKQNSKQ